MKSASIELMIPLQLGSPRRFEGGVAVGGGPLTVIFNGPEMLLVSLLSATYPFASTSTQAV